MRSKLPAYDTPAQEWIQAGLAMPTEKGKDADFGSMSFMAAQANQLVFLTALGALTLDREGESRTPPSPH